MKTSMILAGLAFSLTANAGYQYDRNLNNSEIRKLLPAYVAMVERDAAKILSANEMMGLNAMVGTLKNRNYVLVKDGKIVGLQALSPETIAAELENYAKEIRATSSREREEAIKIVVEGFKNPTKAGSIKCQLGYASSSKLATDRIVKCEDYRFQNEPDNEWMDRREFILSIDAKTLESLSVLEVNHFQAG